MRTLLLLILLVFFTGLNSQNIDYEASITRFTAEDNCEDFFGDEEHTWRGFLSDNTTPTETYSGCVTRDINGSTVVIGSYAVRNRFDINATSITGRLDAFEDDNGSRCNYDAGDDCRAFTTASQDFVSPLEYQQTSAQFEINEDSYGMRVEYRYNYHTTSLNNAVDNLAESFIDGGNRPFWGATGNWGFSGNDCAVSGTITNNQSSSLRHVSQCNSQIQFYWRVSSEQDYDWLEFYVNNVRIDRISGDQNWTPYTYAFTPDNTVKTIEWRYVKDGSLSEGLDRGLIDFVQLTSATELIPDVIGNNQVIAPGGWADPIMVVTPGVSFGNSLNYRWQSSLDGNNWTNLPASGTSYNPGTLNETTYYRRRISDNCGLTSYSNVVTIEVDPTLPIELGMFTAKAYRPGINQINWQTLSEIDNDYFELERSLGEGDEFQAIARILGAGNSQQPLDYDYLDDQLPNAKVLYYRLKQVDVDGTTTFSNVVAVESTLPANEVSVFPNPAYDVVNITGQAVNSESVTIQLFNPRGKLVSNLKTAVFNERFNNQISVADLPQGVYYLLLKNEAGATLTHQKIIVQ